MFIPLGGSRVGPVRRRANLLLTFLLSGLWHGASWNFLIWGGVNGLAMLPQPAPTQASARPREAPGSEGLVPAPGVLARMLGTFAITCVTWVFFRAATFRDALSILARVATGLFDAAGYAALGAACKPSPLGAGGP